MKGAIHHSNGAVDVRIAAIGSVLLNSRRQLSKKGLIYWPTAEVPHSCLYTHSGISLAAFPDPVDRLNVGPFVHCPSTHLHPGMRFEGELLRTDHHPRRDAVTPEQARGQRRTLQAKGPLRVPNAGVIDSVAHPIGYVSWRFLAAHAPVADNAMQCREITGEEQQINGQETNQSPPQQKSDA